MTTKEMRILVVDDNFAIGRWLRFLLEAEGACVDVADSGPDALRCIEKGRRYDLVLLDVRMPQWDGAETLSRMRLICDRPFVVFMSGDMGEYTVEQLLGFGAEGVLSKPIDLVELDEYLRRARERREPVPESFASQTR